MLVSGLIISLDPSADRRESALRTIAEHPQFLLGDCAGLRAPLALEAASSNEAEAGVRWLQQLPGVTFVDVVYIQECDQ